jgi:hypothetical protein
MNYDSLSVLDQLMICLRAPASHFFFGSEGLRTMLITCSLRPLLFVLLGEDPTIAVQIC